ncbi:MAG: XRE family transcriptional regulator [Spirochaetes bacterium]|nr:MAG: XRE family transcriptional regulator [Spirochaetota bacterium]
MTGRLGAHAPWETLTAVREAQGMSKTQLARRASMNLSHVSALELGRVSPRAQTVKTLADALGVSVSAITPPGRGRPASVTEGRVREIIFQELGLDGTTPEPEETLTNAQRNSIRVAANMSQRGFLQSVQRIRTAQASEEDVQYVLSVLEDAVEWLRARNTE